MQFLGSRLPLKPSLPVFIFNRIKDVLQAMQKKDAKELLKKYKAGNCTEEEKSLLESWYLRMQTGDQPDLSGTELESDLRDIWMALPVHEQKSRRIFAWPRVAAAAAILVFLSLGAYFLIQTNRQPAEKLITGGPYQSDIPPGSNKAVLTLADGTQVMLDEAAIGELVNQDNIHISKTEDGLIVYDASAAVGPSRVSYNTVSTPNGGQYKIILPDGTKVWLNAASTLRYPIAFTGRERRVELNGEGYFEVARDEARPFMVRAGNQEIQVLGTHFNVMAYRDEPAILTTLLEGSVTISVEDGTGQETGKRGRGNRKLLKPGQQAAVRDNSITVSSDIDLKAAVAWKNGKFIFANEPIESIMRKVSRWYNVEIVYRGNMEGKDFIGTVSRYDNVSKVLKMLELTRTVHFKIEGRRITVMP